MISMSTAVSKIAPPMGPPFSPAGGGGGVGWEWSFGATGMGGLGRT
jgi:hypothetical protein